MAQYPPPAGQVYTPAPQPVPQQKSNTWLIVLIVVLVLCCLCLLILGGCTAVAGPGFFNEVMTGVAKTLTAQAP